MARVYIEGADLQVGDRGLDYEGGIAYTVEKVWRATAAQARDFVGLHRGDVCAEVRWMDGGLGDRYYDPAAPLQVDRP